MAKVFVKARGLNILPSWASSRNTGKKEMIMMINEKKIALPTCLAARMTVLELSFFSSSVPSDSFRYAFSTITMEASTRTPMARAIPPKGHNIGGDTKKNTWG